MEIIHALMVHSAKWKGEEGLIFVPLVALLPRKAALKVLHQYQHSKRQSERIFANECITEFEMEDTEAAVKEYSGKK